MPTHNRADVIAFAIQSALDQTEQDFELLVVGDGCTDSTAQVVASFDDPRIRWYDLPKGPGFGYANRNVALREAKGDFIAFLAHDDMWFPDHLERLAEHFKSDSIHFAYSRTLWVRTDGKILPIVFNLHLEEHLGPFLRMEINYIAALNVMHRRSSFETVGFWDDSLPAAGDQDMWRRIIENHGPRSIAFEPTPTAFHFRANWRPVNQSVPPDIRWMAKWIQASTKIPPALLLEVRQDASEQSVAAARLNDKVWIASVRSASAAFIDRLASEFARKARGRDLEFEQVKRALRQKLLPNDSIGHRIWQKLRGR